VRAGSTIGQYRVVRKIGEGGMGVVFVGEHVLIGRKAAIKLLKREVSEHRGTVERFFNEARAIAAIQDPGIPQLFDVGVTRDKSAFIVMELLDGESVENRLARTRVLAPTVALQIARQAAMTLTVVHGLGVVHRDLKPANLFIVSDPTAPGGERIKILDFGIAKLGPELRSGAQTRDGAIIGTPVYMSPEQCSGMTVDQRADVYSLGCVLFHMLTGRPPFESKAGSSVMTAHLSEPPPPPSRFAPQLSPAIDELLFRCLAKSRADRLPSMAEVVAECDRLLVGMSGDSLPPEIDGTTVPLGGPPTTLSGAIEPSSRSPVPRWKWFAGAIAAGALIGAAAVAMRGNDDAGGAGLLRVAPAHLEVAVPPPDAPILVPIDAVTIVPEVQVALPPPPPVKPAADTPAKPSDKPVTHSKPRPSEPGSDLYDDRN
jgi:serine/threonine protein kinase